jgi:hypothetical protein
LVSSDVSPKRRHCDSDLFEASLKSIKLGLLGFYFDPYIAPC